MHPSVIKKLQKLENIFISEGNSSQNVSDLYADIKMAFGYPAQRNEIIENFLREIPDEATCIAASGYGGVPAASILSYLDSKKLSMLRDKPKGHGSPVFFDGHVPGENDKLLIIDDVFTTGGSLRKIIEKAEQNGAEVIGCMVVYERGNASGFEYPVKSMIKPDDILK